jgi:lysozyme
MGTIEVVLLKPTTGDPDYNSVAIPVRYCSPFMGATSQDFEGSDPSNINDVQRSYGMWMVPPDIGTTVLVIFLDGDINQGFWIGCVGDMFQNHMVPGIAASQYVSMSADQKKKYGTNLLPVGEYLKKIGREGDEIDNKTKPVHPFADRLLEQGLLIDTIRGVTSSSARREVPSAVFGISTPGPVDKSETGTRGDIGFSDKVNTYVGRLGGSSFVMDDGDKEGQNELIRIRTRTGHQILMHNSSDLIYIGNSKGTAWIELTSSGKIDIFAQDSVSIHSENDFNFRADRDVNIEAGRNLNVSVKGTSHTDVTGDYILNVTRNGVVSIDMNHHLRVGSNSYLTSDGDTHVEAANIFQSTPGVLHLKSDGSLFVQSGATINQTAASDWKVSAGGSISENSGADWKVSAGGSSNITSSHHLETAGKIDMNGPSATAAEAAEAATAAALAEHASHLPTYSLPNTQSDEGWSNGQFFKAEDLVSIMKRVPTHEPWAHHENINPNEFSVAGTDLGATELTPSVTKSAGSDTTIKYNALPATAGTPPAKTGITEDDNIAAFLWTIRVCEGTSGSKGYNTMFTGKTFDSFADHPRQAISAGVAGKSLTSTAAGAYQFLSSTWDEVQKATKLPDFSPASQDKACIFLLKRLKALDDIKAGRFKQAIDRCKTTWASLPDSPYNQHPKSLTFALNTYQAGGGTVTA